MKKGDYYKWKEGKRLFKAPWVYKYYEGVTDENQYNLANKVIKRGIIAVGVLCYVLGIILGSILF